MEQDNQIIDAEMTETTPRNALAISHQRSDLLPELTQKEALQRYDEFNKFVKSLMKDGVDYGEIPGTSKPTLFKPGAEKLTTFFGLTVKFVHDKVVEDFDKPLFFYRVTCQLWKGDRLIAEASGSCNSMEDRYAWRWVQPHEVPDELDRNALAKKVSTVGEWGWAYEKRATTGKYGKPEEYWQKFDEAIKTGTIKRTNQIQPWNNKEDVFLEIESVLYRVPNENIFTLVNTILKMAEKRALVASTLIACNASEYFTQDMEDIAVDVDATPPVKPAATKTTSAPPPPPEPEEPKGNLVPKPERPMTPEQVKDGIETAKKHFLGEEATEKDRNRLAAAINKVFADAGDNQEVQDAKRYTVISWLTGASGSTKDLSHEEVKAMMAWTGQDKNSLYTVSKEAHQEILAIYKQCLIEEGQTEMELDG